jgi:hypothetical protein
MFPSNVQQVYMSFIIRGPKTERWGERFKHERGREPSHEENESYIRYWQYTKLYPIHNFLDQNWQQLFSRLREEFCELDHPDFLFYMSSWVGPTSPHKAEELEAMSIEELISYLNTWKLSGDRMSPTQEGLGRELTALVASKPEHFSSEALRFQGLDPTYAPFFRGHAERIKLHTEWKPIITLCHWVTAQPREIPERSGEYSDLDPLGLDRRNAVCFQQTKSDSQELL